MKSLLTATLLLFVFVTLLPAAEEQTINVNSQLQQWRDYYGQRAAWPKSHGWKPFKRYEWDAIQRGWPDGNIPAAGLWEAFQERARMPHSPLDEPWVNLGPFNHSGRSRVIRFLPGNP